jgi:hypothetical protein
LNGHANSFLRAGQRRCNFLHGAFICGCAIRPLLNDFTHFNVGGRSQIRNFGVNIGGFTDDFTDLDQNLFGCGIGDQAPLMVKPTRIIRCL